MTDPFYYSTRRATIAPVARANHRTLGWRLVATLLGILALGIIWHEVSGLAATGLFIALFANNMTHSIKLNE